MDTVAAGQNYTCNNFNPSRARHIAVPSSAVVSIATRPSVDIPQAVVYGLVADLDTEVRVSLPDGTTTKASGHAVAKGTYLQGAAGTFVAAGTVGQLSEGAKESLVRPDGTLIDTFGL